MADALSFAHVNGVVHCDIKPGNLLVTEAGRVKIADFGISRVMQEENTGLTGLVIGTPAYMSPEQIRGERPTPLTDMYALGIVMWHCLMGAPPFTRGDIAYQHVHVPLPPMDGVTPELERIVRKAAGKTMADRYPSLEVMAQDLRQFLRRQCDATIMQTPPPGQAATIMQTPPPRQAATIMQTPPPRQAATIMHTPPPRQAATVMHTPPPQPASPPVPPPTPTASTPAATSGRDILAEDMPPAVGPAGGVPSGGGPVGGTAQPSSAPAPPPPSAIPKKAAIGAAVVLLAAAALWGLFPRSKQPGPAGDESAGSTMSNVIAPAVTPAAESVAPGRRTSSSRIPPPAPAPRASSPPAPSPRRAGELTPAPQPAAPNPPSPGPVASYTPAPAKCAKAACFEIFDAAISPDLAQPGQTIRCTARYTFRHTEGGTGPLEVEESAQPDIRSSRGANRRIKAGPGPNLFELSFKVPDRAGAGTYPVTLSVRRRSITESVKVQLVVTK